MGKGQGGGKQIGSGYTIRVCRSHQELRNCVKLQKRIWGLEDRELYPERIFVVTNKIGGAVLGAFDPQGRPAGFLIYIPAWDEIGRYYYSLALGISAQHQNRGLGRALKLEQRRRALEAGVDRIKWTFDPLRIKNAFFNLSGLGAFSRRYIPDHYGQLSTNQRAGLNTDRFEIEWRLRSARVRRAVGGGKGKVFPGAVKAEVALPLDVWKTAGRNLKAARAEQFRLRREFLRHFSRGLAVTGVRLGESEAFYLLESYED